MAEEEATETQQRSDDKEGSVCQTPISVIEIPDSSNDYDEETRPSAQMEEKSFISGLHSYMRVRGTPIERIPHLGFKQTVEKLGGYDSVTTKRLWKRVYDELGGSPGSTSAATCTRKHYERLVLPYERHLKGEEDKPLPPTKPRKPYKRNADGKMDKAEGKKKRIHLDRDMDSQLRIQRNDLVLHPHPSMRTIPSDKVDRSKPSSDLSIYDLAHFLPMPSTCTWTPPVPPAAGAGISPLEKKKRMAQASLRLRQQGEESQRPSVILCSSPGPASSARASSDGSPQPQSSSSSRSPSPLSVSSEESHVENKDKAIRHQDKSSPCLDLQLNHSKVKSVCTDDRESLKSKEITSDKTESNSQPVTKHFANERITNWMPVYKGTHFTPSFHSSSFHAKYDLAAASSSSFTKVVPKTVQLLRPAPIRLGYKIHQTRQVPDDSATKKLNSTSQRTNQTEKWENSQSRLCKAPLSQHSFVHNLPTACVVSSYNKSGRGSRPHMSFHPTFLPNRMRPPHQLMYRQVPVNPGHPAFIGPVAYPFSYSMSHPGYTLPNVMPIYQHKL
ncbi:AT-rich interactive domain-containing protein 5A isoform X2 [Boleophthalmus pectinirostris]|uniref:AT-rich interactive domain-containing protein 5A isoform X2 n=1 Tax=Boleophthalmus pectinirostris TaxID=150288 RepID=UPI00242F84B2|nr:AT-rich interactive domain-containing protein 5A isoform X2 [Boleophthalmus pectinirostris]